MKSWLFWLFHPVRFFHVVRLVVAFVARERNRRAYDECQRQKWYSDNQ